MLEGLRTNEEKVAVVVTLLCYGCPLQAIVHAFGLDERTVATWQRRAGKHCERIHTAVVEQGQVKSKHIQADEIRAKGRKIIVWMALAMDVSSRLWLAGEVSLHRDRRLIDRLFLHVRACCQCVCGLLVWTDGKARVSGEHCAGFPKQSQKAERSRKMLSTNLARSLSCASHQACQKEKGGRDHTQSGQRKRRTSERTLTSYKRRDRVEHCFY
jgi:transposase-like protein